MLAAVAGDVQELDMIERRLIALLQEDGRMSVQDLAKRARCSEVTARRKLRRLLDEQIVQIVGAVDPFLIGFESPVIIGLKVDRKKIDDIATQLSEHPAIRFVAAATGNDDLIIEVVAASNHDLANFLLGYLSQIDGVVDTHASLIMRIYKQSWKWGVKGVADADVAPLPQARANEA
jgi:Lrp/AsnC family transcriptional regulator, regulator for asnA, asnC and gidA